MKFKAYKTVNVVIRMSIILFAVIFLSYGSSVTELKIENENLNRSLDLTSMSEKVKIENAYLNSLIPVPIDNKVVANDNYEYVPVNNNDLYQPIDTYSGVMTGYSQYCAGCGGYIPGLKVNIRDTNNILYNDREYGTVRIVAASPEFPFGSIIKFNLPSVSSSPIVAVVADGGGAIVGTKLDLLVESNEYALQYVGRKTVSYDILRIGWER